MHHTQKPYAWVYGQLIFWVEVLTQCYLVNCILTIFTFTPLCNFLFCVIKWKHMKRFFGGPFQLAPALGMICVNKNVHLVMQHLSLGSSTEGPTDTSKILIPMSRLWQEPPIYICLSPVKEASFMHPKWEGCIVINSLIFVVVCRNILYCINLGKNYLWTKPAPNKKRWRTILKNLTQAYSLVKRIYWKWI